MKKRLINQKTDRLAERATYYKEPSILDQNEMREETCAIGSERKRGVFEPK